MTGDLTPCLPECVVESIETSAGPLYTWRVSCTRCRQQLDAGQVQGSRDQQFVDRAARARAASIASRRRGEWHARLMREAQECDVARELRQKREGAGAPPSAGQPAEGAALAGLSEAHVCAVNAPQPEAPAPSRLARRDDDDRGGRRPMRGRGPVIFAGGVLPRRSLRPWELAGEPSRSPGGAATPTNGADE